MFHRTLAVHPPGTRRHPSPDFSRVDGSRRGKSPSIIRSCRLPLQLGLVALLAGVRLLALPADNEVSTTRARAAPVFTFYFENDIFSGSDEHYSNGVKFSWLTADIVEWGQKGWRKTLVEHLPFVNRPGGHKAIGYALGQSIYTPRKTELTNPDPLDRPYAGWLYLELAFVSKTPSISDTFSVQAGLIGPHSLAEDLQRIVHGWLDVRVAKSWDYQLRNEFGVNLIYERRWRLYARALVETLGIDLIPHAGASLGNVLTYANAGAALRVGLNLPSDFGVQLARPGSVGGSPTDDLDPRVALDRNFSVFLFGAVDGRAVARNIFLDGNTFRESRSVPKEVLVADLTAGIGLIAGRWQLTYLQVWRTREFRAQSDFYSKFGSLTLSLAF
jgi:lipid A 3-O-deacylase